MQSNEYQESRRETKNSTSSKQPKKIPITLRFARIMTLEYPSSDTTTVINDHTNNDVPVPTVKMIPPNEQQIYTIQANQLWKVRKLLKKIELQVSNANSSNSNHGNTNA